MGPSSASVWQRRRLTKLGPGLRARESLFCMSEPRRPPLVYFSSVSGTKPAFTRQSLGLRKLAQRLWQAICFCGIYNDSDRRAPDTQRSSRHLRPECGLAFQPETFSLQASFRNGRRDCRYHFPCRVVSLCHSTKSPPGDTSGAYLGSNATEQRARE